MMSDAIVATVIPDYDAYAKGLWSGETKLNDATGKKIFQRMDQFASFYEKDVMGVDYASVPGRFVGGKAAMLADGTWQAAQLTKADPNFKFGYFTLPGDVAGSEPMQLYGKYDLAFSIFGKTKNKEAALNYLDTLSQKDVYTEFVNAIGFIPTMPGVTVSNEYVNSLAPLNKNFHLAFGINAYKAPKGVGKYAGFQLSMLKRLGGEAEPDKLADMAQQDWDAALKNAK
jgi:raffinose/stachyose/melibiose transport system substrate-binding protein